MPTDIMRFKKANCKNCYKCLRECPVKAIAFRDGQAEILNEDCLICGHCLTACPQNAKEVRDDTGIVRDMIESGKKVIASVAPSFIASFDVGGIEEFAQALGQLGFYGAYETSHAAKLVSAEYQRLLSVNRMPNLVTSCCPTIIKLIEKYHTDCLRFLAPVLTPMAAHARILRAKFGNDGIGTL